MSACIHYSYTIGSVTGKASILYKLCSSNPKLHYRGPSLTRSNSSYWLVKQNLEVLVVVADSIP